MSATLSEMSDSAESAGAGNPYSEEDLAAAEEVLAATGVCPQTSDYERHRIGLAKLRAELGADRFDLLYGRRQPRNAAERLDMQSRDEGWSQERYAEELQRHATRPVDLDMVREFHELVSDRVIAYSSALGSVVDAANDQMDPGRADREENSISDAFAALGERLDLFSDEIRTVDEFLTSLRTIHGGPVRCGDRSGRNAHALALAEIADARDGWVGCVEISQRSRSHPAYDGPMPAAQLFYTARMESRGQPRPRDLLESIRVEFAEAKATLRRGTSAPLMPVSVASPGMGPKTPAKRSNPEDDPANWLPASSFDSKLAVRIRQAAQPGRQQKRVRRREHDGLMLYFLPDIRAFWPGDLPAHLRSGDAQPRRDA